MPESGTSGAPRLRVLLGEAIAIGPGKAQLLERIEATGSISAAARTMGMSYRRAWLLVDTMNQCFHEPLVETAAGGKGRARFAPGPRGAGALPGHGAAGRRRRRGRDGRIPHPDGDIVLGGGGGRRLIPLSD